MIKILGHLVGWLAVLACIVWVVAFFALGVWLIIWAGCNIVDFFTANPLVTQAF